MKNESFLFERQSLWLWISVVTVVIFTLIYFWHAPLGPANGGTGYGLTTGIVAACAMVFLMLYAKRKRAYQSNMGTLKTWLSAHIWIGSALIILVPLHSGFQFACNVHTLSYVFIVIAVITGIWGVFLCVSVPPNLEARREGASAKSLLTEIQELSSSSAYLLKNKSTQFLQLVNEIDFTPELLIWKIIFIKKFLRPELDKKQVGKKIHGLSEVEQTEALKLVVIVERKILLINKLYRELRLLALLKIWLYIHLPFAVGAFTLLIIHIFSVFYLW